MLNRAQRYLLQNEWFLHSWRGLLPLLGMGMDVLVVLSYYYSMRRMVAPQWCLDSNNNNCGWMTLHDVLVAYFGSMIFFHYAAATWRSPGVVVPTAPAATEWRFWKGQGGVLGWNAKCMPVLERQRVNLYGELQQEQQQQQREDGKRTEYVPSPFASFCTKCHHWRPPRSRHCSTCQRCVLQYDHHCIWVNQCIGYNNYRSFVLMVFYFSAGCWYGVFLLFRPFVDQMWANIQPAGTWNYLRSNYFILVPAPFELIMSLTGNGSISDAAIICSVFPLLLAVGLVLVVFLLSHIRMMAKARTTLEHNIIESTPHKTKNAFDQGSKMANINQVMGSNWLLLLLPIPVNPPPPYLPSKDN